MKSAAFGLAALLAAGICSPCGAEDLKATQKFTGTQIAFETGAPYTNYTLTITGPYGVHAIVSTKSGAPTFDLRQLSALDDGAYTYNLTASSPDKVPQRLGLDNGRPGGPDEPMLRSVSVNGRFDVKGGTIVKYDPNAAEPSARQK